MHIIIPKISKISPTGLPNISSSRMRSLIECHSSSIIASREPSDISVTSNMTPRGKPAKISQKNFFSHYKITPAMYFTGPL